MAFVGFRNTHNNTIYINPEQVIYVSSFEEEAVDARSELGKDSAALVLIWAADH